MKIDKILIVGKTSSGKSYFYLPIILKILKKKYTGNIFFIESSSFKYNKKNYFGYGPFWNDIEYTSLKFKEPKPNDILFIDELYEQNKYSNKNPIVICVQDLEQAKYYGLDIDKFKIIKSSLTIKYKSYFFGLIKFKLSNKKEEIKKLLNLLSGTIPLGIPGKGKSFKDFKQMEEYYKK